MKKYNKWTSACRQSSDAFNASKVSIILSSMEILLETLHYVNFEQRKCCTIERLLLLLLRLLFSNNRFNVNLLCGSRPDSANIALQLSSRFDTSWLIRNSKQSQEWGEEEGLAPRKFPFLPQVPFTVSIYTSPDAFLVRACLYICCFRLLLRLFSAHFQISVLFAPF